MKLAIQQSGVRELASQQGLAFSCTPADYMQMFQSALLPIASSDWTYSKTLHRRGDSHRAGSSLCRDDVARRADDATHRAADRANQGVDKVRETRRDLHRDADSPREVREKGADAVDSAKDAAVQTKCAACMPLPCRLLALRPVSCGIC